MVLFRGRLVLASKAAKNRKEDDVIVFSLSTENAAGTGGGTEEAALRDINSGERSERGERSGRTRYTEILFDCGINMKGKRSSQMDFGK